MWIYANCKQSQQVHLHSIKSSYASWEALKKVHGLKHLGCINFLTQKFFIYKAKESESVNHVVSALKNLVLLIWEIRKDVAPIDLYMAIKILSVFDNKAYEMAIFHLKRKPIFTSAKVIESLKAVGQSLKDKKETQLDMA